MTSMYLSFPRPFNSQTSLMRGSVYPNMSHHISIKQRKSASKKVSNIRWSCLQRSIIPDFFMGVVLLLMDLMICLALALMVKPQIILKGMDHSTVLMVVAEVVVEVAMEAELWVIPEVVLLVMMKGKANSSSFWFGLMLVW